MSKIKSLILFITQSLSLFSGPKLPLGSLFIEYINMLWSKINQRLDELFHKFLDDEFPETTTYMEVVSTITNENIDHCLLYQIQH